MDNIYMYYPFFKYTTNVGYRIDKLK